MFKINNDGTSYTKLQDFNGSNNGNGPQGDLCLAGKTLYGTTNLGGIYNQGVIFEYGITPSVQAFNIITTNIQAYQADINWTNGDGDKRVVFVTTDTLNSYPLNNTTYIASADWNNKGTELGTSNWFCVYNGTGNTVTLTNLSPNNNYHVWVFEYNGNAGAEQYNVSWATHNPYFLPHYD